MRVTNYNLQIQNKIAKTIKYDMQHLNCSDDQLLNLLMCKLI